MHSIILNPSHFQPEIIFQKSFIEQNHWILWFTEPPSFPYFVAFGQGGFGVHRPNCGYPEFKKCPPWLVKGRRPQLLSLASLSLIIWLVDRPLVIWWLVHLVEVWLKLQPSTSFTRASSWQSLKVQHNIWKQLHLGCKVRVTLTR